MLFKAQQSGFQKVRVAYVCFNIASTAATINNNNNNNNNNKIKSLPIAKQIETCEK